jgi:hypothetical protein
MGTSAGLPMIQTVTVETRRRYTIHFALGRAHVRSSRPMPYAIMKTYAYRSSSTRVNRTSSGRAHAALSCSKKLTTLLTASPILTIPSSTLTLRSTSSRFFSWASLPLIKYSRSLPAEPVASLD